MPAQVSILWDQLERMYKEAGGHGIVVCESPMSPVLEVWVIDEESQGTETHRTLILDESGETLSDHRANDNE